MFCCKFGKIFNQGLFIEHQTISSDYFTVKFSTVKKHYIVSETLLGKNLIKTQQKSFTFGSKYKNNWNNLKKKENFYDKLCPDKEGRKNDPESRSIFQENVSILWQRKTRMTRLRAKYDHLIKIIKRNVSNRISSRKMLKVSHTLHTQTHTDTLVI